MKDEIVAGIKNALMRGQTIEQAAQSFVNAGYNPAEVNAAYQAIASGASGIISTSKAMIQTVSPQTAQIPTQALPTTGVVQRKKSGTGLIITLIIISMLILLGAIGYFFYALYAQ